MWNSSPPPYTDQDLDLSVEYNLHPGQGFESSGHIGMLLQVVLVLVTILDRHRPVNTSVENVMLHWNLRISYH